MHTLSLRQLAAALQHKQLSSTELTTHYLKQISQHSHLNAFISVDEEGALHAARQADEWLRQGTGKPLTGIPMAHKDIFCTQRMPTTCASKMLAHFHSPYAATLVKQLDGQGCVLLGKTNMDEFGMGSANENSHFGAVLNPWDTKHAPGGSSGGSAAAVAANLVAFATASDTGGSIRQPSAFCGTSGLKPTYGLVSRFGMLAYASSLEQAGPIANCAEDLAFILQAMAGFDPNDSTSINQPVPDYLNALKSPTFPLRIGLPSCFFQPEVDEGIQHAIKQAIAVFEQAGAEIVEIELTLQPLWVPCYYIVACAEASSNLSRYDGIRFGHRAISADTIQTLIARSRSEGFGTEVKRRILTGTYLLSSEHLNDDYVQAQKIRRLIQNELLTVLNQVDVIIGPTTPTTAFKLGEKIADPTQRYLADVFTVAANLAGLPALSIPVGFSQNLPVGMQIMGTHFSESRLLNLAHYYQQQTSWHCMKPDQPRETP